MQYPDKLIIMIPHIVMVTDNNTQAFSSNLYLLRAFALLHATRQPNGRVEFREQIEFDLIGDQSIDMLTMLCEELGSDTTIGGLRLDRQISALIRLPRDSDREAEGKAPLLRLGLALGKKPIDVGWFDRLSGSPSLNTAANRHGLPAQWQNHQPAREAVDARLMSARARSVWAAIAEKLFEKGEARRKAFASFDKFNSKVSGMK